MYEREPGDFCNLLEACTSFQQISGTSLGHSTSLRTRFVNLTELARASGDGFGDADTDAGTNWQPDTGTWWTLVHGRYVNHSESRKVRPVWPEHSLTRGGATLRSEPRLPEPRPLDSVQRTLWS